MIKNTPIKIPKIFISYRRRSWPFTHRLAESLQTRLNADIFVDFVGIDEADFEKSILRHLRESDIVLLVITDETFEDRIHQDDDWVRREIRTALENGIPLVLVCVEGRLPLQGLPEDIKQVSRMQGINFYPEYFTSAVDRLVEFLSRITPKPPSQKPEESTGAKVVPKGHNTLVERLRLAPNSSWANVYLDLVKELIEVTKATEDDPRLAMTIPKQFKGWQFLPININNRYVLNAVNGDPYWGIGIICSREFAGRTNLHGGRVWDFAQLPSESKNDEAPPILVKIKDTLKIPRELRQEWHRALIEEMGRAKGSPYRNKHQPAIYMAATDMKYREGLLRDAFAHEFS